MLLLLLASIHNLALHSAPPTITCDMAEEAARRYCRNADYAEFEFACEEDELGMYLFDASCEED